MKNKKLLKAVIALLCVMSLFPLNGCLRKGPAKGSTVTSVSYSCGAMDRRQSFGFWLREENGQIKFDADCYVYDGESTKHICFSDIAVTVEDMIHMQDLAEEKDFEAFLRKNKPRKPSGRVSDASMYGFCVKWDDGTMLDTNRNVNFASELWGFFKNLSERIYEEQGGNAQGEGKTVIELSLSCNHSNFDNCYSFYIRQENDVILFDANASLPNEAEEYESFEISEMEVRAEDMEDLKLLCSENDVMQYVQNYEPVTSDFEVLDETVYIIKVTTEDNSSYICRGDFKAREAVENYFYDLLKKKVTFN